MILLFVFSTLIMISDALKLFRKSHDVKYLSVCHAKQMTLVGVGSTKSIVNLLDNAKDLAVNRPQTLRHDKLNQGTAFLARTPSHELCSKVFSTPCGKLRIHFVHQP